MEAVISKADDPHIVPGRAGQGALGRAWRRPTEEERKAREEPRQMSRRCAPPPCPGPHPEGHFALDTPGLQEPCERTGPWISLPTLSRVSLHLRHSL